MIKSRQVKKGGEKMARRPSHPYNNKRYLGNIDKKIVHDLENEDTDENACQIDEIKQEHIKMFDYHFEASNEGFEDCKYCF